MKKRPYFWGRYIGTVVTGRVHCDNGNDVVYHAQFLLDMDITVYIQYGFVLALFVISYAGYMYIVSDFNMLVCMCISACTRTFLRQISVYVKNDTIGSLASLQPFSPTSALDECDQPHDLKT